MSIVVHRSCWTDEYIVVHRSCWTDEYIVVHRSCWNRWVYRSSQVVLNGWVYRSSQVVLNRWVIVVHRPCWTDEHFVVYRSCWTDESFVPLSLWQPIYKLGASVMTHGGFLPFSRFSDDLQCFATLHRTLNSFHATLNVLNIDVRVTCRCSVFRAVSDIQSWRCLWLTDTDLKTQ